MKKKLAIAALLVLLVASLVAPTAAHAATGYYVGAGALGYTCKVRLYNGTYTSSNWVFGKYYWPSAYPSPGYYGLRWTVSTTGGYWMYDYSPVYVSYNGQTYRMYDGPWTN